MCPDTFRESCNDVQANHDTFSCRGLSPPQFRSHQNDLRISDSNSDGSDSLGNAVSDGAAPLLSPFEATVPRQLHRFLVKHPFSVVDDLFDSPLNAVSRFTLLAGALPTAKRNTRHIYIRQQIRPSEAEIK